MQSEVIISGFGGQGTLYAGQVYAYAGMDEGKHVTWILLMVRKCAVVRQTAPLLSRMKKLVRPAHCTPRCDRPQPALS